MFFLKGIFKKKKVDEFEIWLERNKDGNNFTHLLGIDTKIRQFIDSHMKWVYDNKSMIITAEILYDSAKMLFEIGEITEEEFTNLKEEMKKINFASMAIHW